MTYKEYFCIWQEADLTDRFLFLWEVFYIKLYAVQYEIDRYIHHEY